MIDFPNEESKWTWLAGTVDCDASITLTKHRKKTPKSKRGFYYQSLISFQQTNRPLIKELKDVTGVTGRIQFISPKRKNDSDYWKICVYASRLRIILPKIIPFLVKKKKQAVLLLEALNLLAEHRAYHTPHDQRLEEICHTLQVLHEKGKQRRK